MNVEERDRLKRRAAALRRQARRYAESDRARAMRVLTHLLAVEQDLGNNGSAVRLQMAELSTGAAQVRHLREALRARPHGTLRARALLALAEALYERDVDAEAEQLAREAVDIWSELGPPQDEIDARGLHASTLVSLGRGGEATAAFREAALCSRRAREWRAELHWAQRWFRLMGEGSSAWLRSGRAYGYVELRPEEISADEEVNEFVVALHRLAWTYRSIGERGLAQSALARAVQATTPGVTLAWAALVNHQASVDFDAERTEAAIAGHREAIRIAQLAGATRAAAAFRADLAYVLDRVSDETAVEALEAAADACRAAHDAGSASWALRRLARHSVSAGSLGVALDQLRTAAELATTGASPDGLARSAHGAALLSALRGEPDAQALAERAAGAAAALRDRDLQERIDLALALFARERDQPGSARAEIGGALRAWAAVDETAGRADDAVDMEAESYGLLLSIELGPEAAEAVERARQLTDSGRHEAAIAVAERSLERPFVALDQGATFAVRLELALALLRSGADVARAVRIALEDQRSGAPPAWRLPAAGFFCTAADVNERPAAGVAVLDAALADPAVEALAREQGVLSGLLLSRAGMRTMLDDTKGARRDLDMVETMDLPPLRRASMLHHRALLAERERDLERAIAYGREALELARLGADAHRAALIGVDLARALQWRDTEDATRDARELLHEAIRVLERVGDLKCLARAREHLRDEAPDPDAWLAEQLRLREQTGSPEDIATTLMITGTERGGPEGIELLERAIALYRQAPPVDGMLSALAALASRILECDGSDALGRVIDISRELVDAVEERRRALGTPEARQRFLEQHGGAYAMHATALLLGDRAHESFSIAQLGRARVLEEAIQPGARDGDRIRALRIEQARAVAELRRTRRTGRDTGRAEREVERLEHMLADLTDTASFHRTYTVDDVMQSLDEGTALLAFTNGPGVVLASCVVDDEFFSTVLSMDVDELEQRVVELTFALADRHLRYPHAHVLYETLLAPFLATIGQRAVVVIADGVLQTMPWGALLAAPPDEHEAVFQRRWLERHPVHDGPWSEGEMRLALGDLRLHGTPPPADAEMLFDLLAGLPALPRSSKLAYAVRTRTFSTAPSIGTFIALRGRRAGVPRSALIVGDPRPGPDVTPQQGLRLGRDSRLDPLPHTVDEAWKVARCYQRRLPRPRPDAYDGPAVRVRLGAAATRDQVLPLLVGGVPPDVVHVASHGFADIEEPLLSCLVLTGETTEAACLLLAEVLDLDLSGAIVVLSCCDTGVGRVVGGEGVVGMARAFIQAGASAVCTTLWEVLDETAPKLMEELHKRLSAGQSPATALRRAQLAALDGRAGLRTADWAAFGIVGG